jgi:hypothetical protein
LEGGEMGAKKMEENSKIFFSFRKTMMDQNKEYWGMEMEIFFWAHACRIVQA